MAASSHLGAVTAKSLGISTDKPKFPQFAILGKRLDTFKELPWPNNSPVSVHDLAEAGLVNTGKSSLSDPDQIVCILLYRGLDLLQTPFTNIVGFTFLFNNTLPITYLFSKSSLLYIYGTISPLTCQRSYQNRHCLNFCYCSEAFWTSSAVISTYYLLYTIFDQIQHAQTILLRTLYTQPNISLSVNVCFLGFLFHGIKHVRKKETRSVYICYKKGLLSKYYFVHQLIKAVGY